MIRPRQVETFHEFHWDTQSTLRNYLIGDCSQTTSNLTSYLDLEEDWYTVYQLAEDLFIPGQILVAVNSALGTTRGNVYFNASDIPLVVGKATRSGYKDGNFTTALFRTIWSFEQWNRTHVIVVDHHNHCLRWVDRAKPGGNMTSTFAGRCQRMGSIDGHVKNETEFYQPTDLVINQKDKRVFVSDFKLGRLRMIDLFSDVVYTIYNGGERIYPMGIAFDEKMANIFFTISHGIKSIDLLGTNAVTNITQQTKGRNLTITSPISMTQWEFPDKIIRIAPDLYAVVDRNNRRVGLLDNSRNEVTSICKRRRGRITEPVFGNSTFCQLKDARSVALVNSVLYIGMDGYIARIGLDASAELQATADPSELAITQGWFLTYNI